MELVLLAGVGLVFVVLVGLWGLGKLAASVFHLG